MGMILLVSFKDDESRIIHKIMELLEQDAGCKIISTLPGDNILTFENMTIEPAYRKVLMGGEDIELTSHEFDILYLLAKRPGQVFTKDQIYKTVWDEPNYNAKDNVVSMVHRVRQKIEPDPKHPMFILTVWGTQRCNKKRIGGVCQVTGLCRLHPCILPRPWGKIRASEKKESQVMANRVWEKIGDFLNSLRCEDIDGMNRVRLEEYRECEAERKEALGAYQEVLGALEFEQADAIEEYARKQKK